MLLLLLLLSSVCVFQRPLTQQQPYQRKQCIKSLSFVCVCVFYTLLTPVARSLTSGDKKDGALLLLERFSSNKSVCVCVVLCCPTRLTIQLA